MLPVLAALVIGVGGGVLIASARAKDKALSPVGDARLQELARGKCNVVATDISFAVSVLERVYDEPATDGSDLRTSRPDGEPCVFTFVVGEDSYWQGRGLVRRESTNRIRVLLFSQFDRSLKEENRPSATVGIVFDGDRTYVTDTRSGNIFLGSGRDVGSLKAIGKD
jgi:hypothetical protein